MNANPPEPVTDPDDPLEPHADLRKWIEDFWPGGRKQYKAGAGNLRRPDVVVVNDPTQPPVQSNISQVVEFKFPPDSFGRNQERDYIRIAGARSKFVTLGPAECGCGDDDPDGRPSTQKQSKTSTDMDDVLGGSGSSMSNGSGLPPALPPAPVLPVFP